MTPSLSLGLEHPLKAGKFLQSDNWEALKAVATKLKVEMQPIEWERLRLVVEPTCPAIQLEAGARSFKLGEIGLSYLCYRVGAPVSAALGHYREGRWSMLETLLAGSFTSFKDRYGLSLASRHYVATILDGELLGLMTGYTAVPHSELLDIIEKTGMHKNVVFWKWTPTELCLVIRETVMTRGFFSGIKILNGESGHRALSFFSTMWCESLALADGTAYSWDRAVVESGYARHMFLPKIERVLANIETASREIYLAAAFEKLVDHSGEWACKIIEANWSKIKCRETALTKLKIELDDALIIPRAEDALEVFYKLLSVGMTINKSTVNAAEQMADILLDEAAK